MLSLVRSYFLTEIYEVKDHKLKIILMLKLKC